MSADILAPDNPLVAVVAGARDWESKQPGSRLSLFALVDAAQSPGLWRRLGAVGAQHQSLLNTEGTTADDVSPQLVDLGLATDLHAEIEVVFSAQFPNTAYTLMSSPFDLLAVHEHFARCAEVKLAGNMDMLLAFWDPAILGTLVGQRSDETLHVAGPVFSAEELQAFLSPISTWCYCNRLAQWQTIHNKVPSLGAADPPPFALTQKQEDMLVEASVPDQVLYHLELNQPHLFDSAHSPVQRYDFVRIVLGSARQLGLTGMRDLVNFTALAMIYRRRMQTDPEIVRLLDQVQLKKLSLDQALKLMPE